MVVESVPTYPVRSRQIMDLAALNAEGESVHGLDRLVISYPKDPDEILDLDRGVAHVCSEREERRKRTSMSECATI